MKKILEVEVDPEEGTLKIGGLSLRLQIIPGWNSYIIIRCGSSIKASVRNKGIKAYINALKSIAEMPDEGGEE